ncbi:MAG TPA: HD domain-containing protein [Vitreimonas sp.]|nr:HD domain-containing protein [Vitreimonas sp.]
MSITAFNPAHLLTFYQLAEKLKTTLRHSWLNDGVRRESVAEHSWMMALLAMVLMPHLSQKLDALKVLKMIIVHDLAEAVTTDLPVWEGVVNKAQKQAAEQQAIEQLFAPLDAATRQDLVEVWEEYEARQSPEAVFVKAIDTLDVITQHNVAPIETWDDNDYLWQLSPLQDKFFDIDVVLRQVKDEIDKWSIEKVSAVNNLARLDQAELKKRLG